MRNTIKAQIGYAVKYGTIKGEKAALIKDGERKLFVALVKSEDEMKAEKKGNEEFHIEEVFTTIKGNQFIYWRDVVGEGDWDDDIHDFITKVTA